MPRKCCFAFDRKHSRTNYKGMKLQSFEGWKLYSFPADPQEQNQLKRVSSNKLKNDLKDCDGNIEKTIDLC